MRRTFTFLFALGALLLAPHTAAAQSFGIGARMAWVRSDADADTDSIRFTGGQIRLGTRGTGLEISLDRHAEEFETLNQKAIETPIQVSLLIRLANGAVSPYLLGGPGWYRRTVEPIDDSDAASVSTTEFGWHAGLGLEIRPGRHVGLHGDYRYTFLDFNGDDGEDAGLIDRLLPGHKGSMWTLGATLYF